MRLVKFKDFVEKMHREEALQEMMRLDQELGLYDDIFEGGDGEDAVHAEEGRPDRLPEVPVALGILARHEAPALLDDGDLVALACQSVGRDAAAEARADDDVVVVGVGHGLSLAPAAELEGAELGIATLLVNRRLTTFLALRSGDALRNRRPQSVLQSQPAQVGAGTKRG